jgi:hypothetical protein
MSEGQRLLDVFVSVRPDPEMLEAVKAAHESLISDLQKRLAEVSQAIGATTRTHVTEVSNAVQTLTSRLNALQQASQALQSQNRLTGGGGGGRSTGGGRGTGGGGGRGTGGGGGGTDETNAQIAEYRNQLELLKRANEVEIARATQAGGRQFALPFINANREIKTLLIELDQLRDRQSADLVAQTFERIRDRIAGADIELRRFVEDQAALRQYTDPITVTLGRGDDSARTAAQFKIIADGAKESAIQAGRLSTSIKDIGDLALVDEIKTLKRDFADFERNLRRAKRDGTFDPITVQSGLTGLQQRLADISGRSTTSIQTKEDLRQQNENLRASILQNEIELRLQNQLYVSRLDVTEREIFVRRLAEYDKQKAAVAELLKQRDNTLDKERQINSALNQQRLLLTGDVTDPQSIGLLSTFEGVQQRRGASFNRLQNTAFQVGQAFEDFAVGFQLNGFAGGIRGAANNISFIAQDIASVYVNSDKISQKWKLIAGVGTGIGAALAVTILPPTIAWLESLNDISIEIEDISRKMQDMADDARRVAEANQKTRETLRGIGDQDSFEGVLQQLRDLRTETEDTAKQVEDQLQSIFSSQLVNGLQQSFSAISRGIKQQLLQLADDARSLQADILRRNQTRLSGEQDRPLSFDEALKAVTGESDRQAQQLIDTYQKLQRELDSVRAKSERGIFESDQLINVRNLFESVTKQVEDFSETADVGTKNFAEDLKGNITPLQKAFEDLIKPLKEVEEVLQRRFSAAVDAAQRKTEQLAERQQLLRLQLQGQASEQSTALLDIREFSAQYQDMIDKTLEFYAKSQGVTSAQVEGLREVLRGQASMEIGNKNLTEQKSVLDRIQSVEERIAGLREQSAAARSQMVSPEDFAQQLQQNVLSIEPVDKNTDALEKATNELIELRVELAKLQALEEIRVQRGEIAEFNRNAANLGPQIPRIPSSVDRALLEAERALPFLRAPTVSDLMRMTPIVAPMGGIGGAAGMLDVMKGIPGQGSISDLVSVGVESGIRKALEGIAPALFNRIEGVSEAVKTKDMSPRAQ